MPQPKKKLLEAVEKMQKMLAAAEKTKVGARAPIKEEVKK